MKYDYENYNNLFHDHIAWAFEPQHSVRIHSYGELECISFYKLELRSDGTGSYKDDYFTFNPALWDKIMIQAKLLGCNCEG